jgi:hypothetical protein
VQAFPLDFDAVGEFPEVVYLAPAQTVALTDLIDLLCTRWPDHPPYGGLFDEVIPHLTVVDTPDAALRARAFDEVSAAPRVVSAAHEASLWVLGEEGRWSKLASFPLLFDG